MKKKIVWIVIASMILSMFALTGCGGGGGSDKSGSSDKGDSEPKYESQVFMFDNWEIKTTKDEVRFDEYGGCDNFLLYFTVTNTSDDTSNFYLVDNIRASQHDETLYWGGITDENGDYIVTGEDETDEDVEAGGSREYVYGWELVDDSPVTIEFQAYTTAVESTVLTFEMEGRLTDEWKALIEEEAKKLEELQSATSFDIEGVSGDFVDGWYAKESSDSSVKLVKDGLEGYIEVVVGWGETAEKESNDIAGNFNIDPSSVTVESIGENDYYCVAVSDTMSYMFIDSSAGVLEVKCMFVSLDDARAQIEAFNIK